MDLLNRLEVNVVLDVGANKGTFSKHLRSSGYKGRLVSFEPIKEDCELIKRASAGDPQWIVCDCALGANSETKNFNVNYSGQETVFSSFLPLTNNDFISLTNNDLQVRQVETRVCRLDAVLPDLIRDIGDPRIFLKIDTQGFDTEVFLGAKGCLDLIVGLQSEISVIPIYDGMPHYTDSLRTYERAGFGLVDLSSSAGPATTACWSMIVSWPGLDQTGPSACVARG